MTVMSRLVIQGLSGLKGGHKKDWLSVAGLEEKTKGGRQRRDTKSPNIQISELVGWLVATKVRTTNEPGIYTAAGGGGYRVNEEQVWVNGRLAGEIRSATPTLHRQGTNARKRTRLQ